MDLSLFCASPLLTLQRRTRVNRIGRRRVGSMDRGRIGSFVIGNTDAVSAWAIHLTSRFVFRWEDLRKSHKQEGPSLFLRWVVSWPDEPQASFFVVCLRCPRAGDQSFTASIPK